MPDYGALGQGFFQQLGLMRDYNTQREEVKFNAQLKLKQMALQEKESQLNEKLMGLKIGEANNALSQSIIQTDAMRKFMLAEDKVKKAKSTPDVTPQGSSYDVAMLDREMALGTLVGLKDPGSLYQSPGEQATEVQTISNLKAQGGLIAAQTEKTKRDTGDNQSDFQFAFNYLKSKDPKVADDYIKDFMGVKGGNKAVKPMDQDKIAGIFQGFVLLNEKEFMDDGKTENPFFHKIDPETETRKVVQKSMQLYNEQAMGGYDDLFDTEGTK